MGTQTTAAPVRYSVVGGGAGLKLKVHPTTGALTLHSPLDYERRNRVSSECCLHITLPCLNLVKIKIDLDRLTDIDLINYSIR